MSSCFCPDHALLLFVALMPKEKPSSLVSTEDKEAQQAATALYPHLFDCDTHTHTQLEKAQNWEQQPRLLLFFIKF